jgi:hypothetical protein
LENVQKRAVAMVTNLKGRNYTERLALLGMTTMEDARRRGDLIQMYRVMTGKDRVDPATWFTPTQEMQGSMATRVITGCLKGEHWCKTIFH